MKRSEVEKITGLRRKAILYYEEKELISPALEENNYRNYSEEDLNRLIKISLYRRLGLSISEIKNILDSNNKEIGKISMRDSSSLGFMRSLAGPPTQKEVWFVMGSS